MYSGILQNQHLRSVWNESINPNYCMAWSQCFELFAPIHLVSQAISHWLYTCNVCRNAISSRFWKMNVSNLIKSRVYFPCLKSQCSSCNKLHRFSFCEHFYVIIPAYASGIESRRIIAGCGDGWLETNLSAGLVSQTSTITSVRIMAPSCRWDHMGRWSTERGMI